MLINQCNLLCFAANVSCQELFWCQRLSISYHSFCIFVCRELAPGMLEKKDRGRGADVGLRPMEYGAAQVGSSLCCPALSWVLTFKATSAAGWWARASV